MDRRDYLDFWADAKEKVRAFDALDDRRIIFGAKVRGYGHDYKILPTVPERDLIAFEGRTGLTLPLEYRTYLEAFGAGGAGPDYGIRDFRDDDFCGDLSTPFPCTESVWGPDEECPEDDPVWKLPGLAYICNHGCGAESLIELNGPDPGRIWTEWSEGIMKGARFAEIYQDWIAGTAARLERYRRMMAVVNRDPPLDSDGVITVEDIVKVMGSAYRTVDCKDSEGNPDGNRELLFGQPAVGHFLVNDDDELVHVAIRSCV